MLPGFCGGVPSLKCQERVPLAGAGLGGGWESMTSIGLGELNAGLIAIQVQRKTGIPTTANDIIERCGAARVADERGGTDPRDQARVALATALTGGGTPSETQSAILGVLNPLYREFGQDEANRRMLQVMDAVSATGVDAALIDAAMELSGLGRSILGSVANELVDKVSEILGDAGWLNDVASGVGDIVTNVAKFMPYIGAVVKAGLDLAVYVQSFWGPIRGATVNIGASEWCNFGPRLYARLAEMCGWPAGNQAQWTGLYSPFLYENTCYNPNLLGLFQAIRCLDVHQYRLDGMSSNLPKWRHVLSSSHAIQYAKSNSDGLPLVPSLNAELVQGCKGQAAGQPGSLLMIRPYRWYQNQASFRAATIASLFVNGTVCCIQGVGEWASDCRSLAGRGEDDRECYNDNSPWYYVGSPWGKPWWATWGEYHGWGQDIFMLPPSRVPQMTDAELRSFGSSTGALRRWFVDRLRRRDLWIPILDLKDGHDELPKSGTAGLISTRQISRLAPTRSRFFVSQEMVIGDKEKKKPMSTGAKVAITGGAVAAVAGVLKLLKVW